MLFLALFGLSTSALWVRLANAPVDVIGLWRLLGAALVVSLALLIRGGLRGFRWNSKSEAISSLAAGVFFFFHLWTYVYSAQTTTIAHLVIIFSAAPLFTAIGARFYFKEVFPLRLFAVIALAGLGLALIFRDPVIAANSHAVSSSLKGDLAALVSAVLHSAYSLSGKRARQTAPNLNFSFWLYFVAGSLFLSLALILGENLRPESQPFYIATLGLILFPTLLGHGLFTYLLRHMNINVLSCAKLLEPAIAASLAFYLYNEEVSAMTLFAFGLMAIALLILFRPWRTKKPINP